MKWINNRPHPDPLPQEREELLDDSGFSQSALLNSALGFPRKRRMILPLPEGEGWGDGECLESEICSSRRQSALTSSEFRWSGHTSAAARSSAAIAELTMKIISRQTAMTALVLSVLISPMIS